MQLEDSFAHFNHLTNQVVGICHFALLDMLNDRAHSVFAEDRWHGTARVRDDELVGVIRHAHNLQRQFIHAKVLHEIDGELGLAIVFDAQQ